MDDDTVLWPSSPYELVDTSRCPACFTPVTGTDCATCGLRLTDARLADVLTLSRRVLDADLARRDAILTVRASQRADAAEAARAAQSLVCGILIGFICGFIGAGGGMMMLLLLTSVLGYELKTAVGTSVFIMAFTALTGSVSHFAIGGAPDLFCLVCCVLSTLLWARIAAKFANKAEPATLNRATGVVLVMLGVAILAVNYL